jgi:hypothetical protein
MSKVLHPVLKPWKLGQYLKPTLKHVLFNTDTLQMIIQFFSKRV